MNTGTKEQQPTSTLYFCGTQSGRSRREKSGKKIPSLHGGGPNSLSEEERGGGKEPSSGLFCNRESNGGGAEAVRVHRNKAVGSRGNGASGKRLAYLPSLLQESGAKTRAKSSSGAGAGSSFLWGRRAEKGAE